MQLDLDLRHISDGYCVAVTSGLGAARACCASDRDSSFTMFFRLRHIPNGYWAIVQEFTHKATVRDIKHLTNVTTNFGRGTYCNLELSSVRSHISLSLSLSLCVCVCVCVQQHSRTQENLSRVKLDCDTHVSTNVPNISGKR